MGGNALAAYGEHIVPTVFVKDTRNQGRAQNFSDLQARHAWFEEVFLLPRDKIALHHLWNVQNGVGRDIEAGYAASTEQAQ